MDIEELRSFCLSLGDVTEKMPFGRFAARYGSILVFYVCNHMFCMFDVDDFTSITVRSTPEEMGMLKDKYNSVEQPLNPAMKYWIQLDFAGDIPTDEIFRQIRRAYEIIADKYTKKR